MKKRFLFVLIFLLFSAFLYGQDESSNWFFGKSVGVFFGYKYTQPQLIDGTTIDNYEGVTSISDKDGNLIFYSDGLTVWNKDHIIIKNGEKLYGNTSSTQSCLILKKPGSKRFYYVFTTNIVTSNKGSRYNIIDLIGGGGRGEVTTKNEMLLRKTCEKITAVEHENGRDIWIVLRAWDEDAFYSYLLTDEGLNLVPVKSPAIPIDYSKTGNAIGYLRTNTIGTKIAMASHYMNRLELYDFNNLTGKLSNPTSITDERFTGIYGVEFSAGSNYIYFTNFASFSDTIPRALYQVAVADNEVKIKNSLYKIAEFNKSYPGALQLANNGKIYLVASEKNFLSSIQEPDKPRAECQFRTNDVSLGDKYGRIGLPFFYHKYFQHLLCDKSDSLFIRTEDITAKRSDTICIPLYASYTSNLSSPGDVVMSVILRAKKAEFDFLYSNDFEIIDKYNDGDYEIIELNVPVKIFPGEDLKLGTICGKTFLPGTGDIDILFDNVDSGDTCVNTSMSGFSVVTINGCGYKYDTLSISSEIKECFNGDNVCLPVYAEFISKDIYTKDFSINIKISAPVGDFKFDSAPAFQIIDERIENGLNIITLKSELTIAPKEKLKIGEFCGNILNEGGDEFDVSLNISEIDDICTAVKSNNTKLIVRACQFKEDSLLISTRNAESYQNDNVCLPVYVRINSPDNELKRTDIKIKVKAESSMLDFTNAPDFNVLSKKNQGDYTIYEIEKYIEINSNEKIKIGEICGNVMTAGYTQFPISFEEITPTDTCIVPSSVASEITVYRCGYKTDSLLLSSTDITAYLGETICVPIFASYTGDDLSVKDIELTFKISVNLKALEFQNTHYIDIEEQYFESGNEVLNLSKNFKISNGQKSRIGQVCGRVFLSGLRNFEMKFDDLFAGDTCIITKSESPEITVKGCAIENRAVQLIAQPGFQIIQDNDGIKLYFQNINSSFNYSIINSLGQILNKNQLSPDNQFINVDSSNLTPGLYFIVLTSEDFVISRKFIIMR